MQIYPNATLNAWCKIENYSNKKWKLLCLSNFLLPLTISRLNMRWYHSFHLNTKSKTQDKPKSLSLTKRKPNENQVQERKTKTFQKVLFKVAKKKSFWKCSQQKLKLWDWNNKQETLLQVDTLQRMKTQQKKMCLKRLSNNRKQKGKLW